VTLDLKSDLPYKEVDENFQKMISGMAYHYLDGLQYIRRVAQHFGLKKINLVTTTYISTIIKIMLIIKIQQFRKNVENYTTF
jgi:hypothetical protein